MSSKKIKSKEIDGIVYKQCVLCKEYKTLDNFYKKAGHFLGCQHWCKNCTSIYYKNRNTKDKNRKDHLKARFNLSIEEYNELYIKQDKRCAICREEFDLLYIDHCHKTNIIRGLLCNNCNVGLGNFKDDLVLLINSIKYLLGFENP